LSRGLAGGSQNVKASAGTVLASGNVGVFPLTLKQTHRFKSAERSVQRPVSRKKTVVVLVTETFGDFVSVEFSRSGAMQPSGADAYRRFEREEMTGFSPHRPTIGRYMLIVKSALSN